MLQWHAFPDVGCLSGRCREQAAMSSCDHSINESSPRRIRLRSANVLLLARVLETLRFLPPASHQSPYAPGPPPTCRCEFLQERSATKSNDCAGSEGVHALLRFRDLRDRVRD